MKNKFINQNKGLINLKKDIELNLSSSIISDLKKIARDKGLSLDDVISLALFKNLDNSGLLNPSSVFNEVCIPKACELYGVSRDTMKRRIARHNIKPSRISPYANSQRKFYYLADIETLFASERQ